MALGEVSATYLAMRRPRITGPSAYLSLWTEHGGKQRILFDGHGQDQPALFSWNPMPMRTLPTWQAIPSGAPEEGDCARGERTRTLNRSHEIAPAGSGGGRVRVMQPTASDPMPGKGPDNAGYATRVIIATRVTNRYTNPLS